jgi:excisionase family DNA binding protein
MASYKVSHRSNGNKQTQTNGNGNGTNGQNGNGNRNPFGKRYLRVSEVAEYLSVSNQTVRNLCSGGAITCTTTLGNHRRIDARSVLEFEGQDYDDGDCDAEKKGGGGSLYICCRVSSSKQAAQGDDGVSSLDRQESRLREFCQTTYGKQPDTVIRRQSSGMNYGCEILQRFISDLADGTISNSTIVVQDPSRLLRFGAKMIECIAKVHGNEIVYAFEQDEDDSAELASELLDVLGFFSARANGNRMKKIAEIILDCDSLKRSYELKLQGYSFKAIADILKSENRQDEKGRGYAWHIVRKNLMRFWDELGKLYGDNRESSFMVFARTKTQRADDSMRVERKDVIGAYRAFCAENGYQPMSDNGIGEDCKKLGWRTTRSKTNTTVYRGLILNE